MRIKMTDLRRLIREAILNEDVPLNTVQAAFNRLYRGDDYRDKNLRDITNAVSVLSIATAQAEGSKITDKDLRALENLSTPEDERKSILDNIKNKLSLA